MSPDDDLYLYVDDGPSQPGPVAARPPTGPAEEAPDARTFDGLLQRRAVLAALWPDRDPADLLRSAPDDTAVIARVEAVRRMIDATARRSGAAREQSQVVLRFLDAAVERWQRAPRGVSRAAVDDLAEAQRMDLAGVLGTLTGSSGAIALGQLTEIAHRLGVPRETAVALARSQGHEVLDRSSVPPGAPQGTPRAVGTGFTLGEVTFTAPTELARAVLATPALVAPLTLAFERGELAQWLADQAPDQRDDPWLARLRGEQGHPSADPYALWWGLYRAARQRQLTLRSARGEPVVWSGLDAVRSTALVASVWDDLKRVFRTGELLAWLGVIAPDAVPAPARPPADEDAELNDLLWTLGHTGLVIEWGTDDLPVSGPDDVVRAYQTDWQRLEAQIAKGYVLRWLERFHGTVPLGDSTLGAFAGRLREHVGRLPAGYLSLKLALACGLRYLPLDPCQPGNLVAYRGYGGLTGRPSSPGAWDILRDHIRHGTALVWVARHERCPPLLASALVTEASRPGEPRNVFREQPSFSEGLAAMVGAPEPSMLLRVQLASLGGAPGGAPGVSSGVLGVSAGVPAVSVAQGAVNFSAGDPRAREANADGPPEGDVPAVTDLSAHDFGAYLQLTWHWPPEVTSATVAWRTDGPPAGPADDRATHRVITRGEYDRVGGFRLDRPENASYHLAVHPRQGVLHGPPARAEVRRQVATVRYDLARGTFRRSRFTLTVQSDASVGSLPEIVVVARPGDMQPLRVDDGIEMFASPAGLSLSQGRPFAMELVLAPGTSPPVYLRAFFRDQRAYESFRLVDPQAERLKVK